MTPQAIQYEAIRETGYGNVLGLSQGCKTAASNPLIETKSQYGIARDVENGTRSPRA
jgi:hypothetical protein